ncbi:MATE family efflux transporter [Spirosoma luteolum]
MRKSILISAVIKAISILVNLVYVPLTLSYIDKNEYGIWLTLSSVLSWFNLLDLGFGNGLRNRFAEAEARNDIEEQRKLFQTTLCALLIIGSMVVITYYTFSKNIHWSSFLGIDVGYDETIKVLFDIIIILFSLQFVLQIYNPIQLAKQKPENVSLALLFGNILGLVFIFFLRKYTKPSIIYLGTAVVSSNLIVLLILFYIQLIKQNHLLKKFKLPNLKDLSNVSELGLKFFVVNVAFVVQYQTTNILISKFFSTELVTQFNISYKMFSTISILFGLLTTPLWSTVTHAKANNDFKRIKNIIQKLMLAWLCTCILGVVILISADQVISMWTSSKIKVSSSINLGVLLIVLSACFSSIFINTLNGLSKIGLQFYLSLITIFFFLPLAHFLSITLNFGIFGLFMAIIIANVNGIIVAPLQVVKAIRAHN